MSYPINYPTPQNANVQIFYAVGTDRFETWTKPQGASFVWFTLIGAGGGGDGATNGGGSGAVTNFMCPAFLIPDNLSISVGASQNFATGRATQVSYQNSNTSATYLLLSANGGPPGSSGSALAMNANYFTAMGIFQSVFGEAGNTGAVPASTTTFLSAGGITALTSNYGYGLSANNTNGFFQMQPIMVGLGGLGNGRGGIGCGGGVSGQGGDGLCVIITW